MAPLQETVARMADQREFSGSILVSIRDSVVVRIIRGNADREEGVAAGDSTAFPIASLTKLFVRHATLLLMDDGRLRMDEKLSTFFPELSGSASVTIADLLYHTSGIPDLHNEDAAFRDWRRVPRWIDADDLIRRIAALGAPRFAAGTDRQYSNSNYLLLARILERRSGLPLDRLLAERIFRPFGMNHTGLYAGRSLLPGHARCYEQRGDSAVPMGDFDFRHYWGSGNAFSTATDLERYARGVRSALPDLWAESLSAHTGRFGGIRTAFRSIPSIGVTAVVLANDDRVDAGELLDDVLRTALPAFASPVPTRSDTTWPGDYSAAFLGRTVRFGLRHNDGWALNDAPLLSLSDTLHVSTERGLLTVRFTHGPEGRPQLLLNDNGNILVARRSSN